MRILGVVRLSHATEATTSPERQRKEIETWAARSGHEIVGWAEDIGVSATVSPWDRPSLGPWLAKPGEYEGLAVWRVDRIARRVIHLATLLDWCHEHGKTLASATEPFDVSSPLGKMFAQMIAMLAEGELEAIKERAGNSRAHLRSIGRWHGGSTPFGYQPVKNPVGPGWTLIHDPEALPILREIIARVIEGQSVTSVANDLNRRNVASPRDHTARRTGKAGTGKDGQPRKPQQWTAQTIERMLASRALLGQVEHRGRVVRSDDGLPLQRAEPLVSPAEWEAIQRARGAARRPKYRAAQDATLSGIARCLDCGESLHFHWMVKDGSREYRYYRCAGRTRRGNGCAAPAARAEWLEATTEALFMVEVGGLEVLEKRLIPGEDHSAELAQVEQALTDIREDRAAGLYTGERGAEEFRAMYRRLEDRRAALEALPQRPDRYEMVPTGRTFRTAWAALDDVASRRRFLLDVGVVVRAKRGEAVLEIPTDLRQRVEQQAAVSL